MMLIPRATQYLLYILICLIPFSIRYVFDSPINFQTGAYSDFTSLSIYLSDFIVLALIGCVLVSHATKKISKIWFWLAGVTVAWLILGAIFQYNEFITLQTYFTVRIILLLMFAGVLAKIEVSRENLAWLFTVLGAMQALVASAQFLLQKSLGLYWIGESHLGPTTDGVAKIVAHGTTMIRGYGTFPHANLLAAFLVITTIFNLYLLTKTYLKPRGILLYILLFLNIFGIFITFSRGGMLALGVAIFILSLNFLINKEFSRGTKVIVPGLVAIAISISILFPFLSTRATISDNAVKERVFYNQIGREIVAENLIEGVGAGVSVLHMEQYSRTLLEPWEIQPIHNFYLISWAEMGIGVLTWLALIIMPFIALFKRKIGDWQIALLSIGFAIATLFLFDHYFYTIWPTQILLWLIVGLALANISRETVDKPLN